MFKRKKTIAILGVDGAGKSTVVEKMALLYGSRCSVNYMGYTRFEDPRIENLKGKRFSGPVLLFLIYRCFWKRYLKAKNNGDIVIFDRYVHEIFINSKRKGWYNWCNIILYKYLFPMPDKLVYLYCPVEESLKRKDDIMDRDVFVEMKRRFDDYFLNRKDVLTLDSSKMKPEAIVTEIDCYIDNNSSYEK